MYLFHAFSWNPWWCSAEPSLRNTEIKQQPYLLFFKLTIVTCKICRDILTAFRRREIPAGDIYNSAKHYSVHYRLNPPVNLTFWSVIKQHVLLILTRMTRNLMKAENQMPRVGEMKKQPERYCNNRMQIFFYSETLSDGLKSFSTEIIRKNRGREICCPTQNLLYIL